MSHDDDERSAQEIEQEMEDEAGRMQSELDELGEHVKDASRKAEETRRDVELPGDEPVETVAGDAADRSTSSDDPVTAVGDPEDADD